MNIGQFQGINWEALDEFFGQAPMPIFSFYKPDASLVSYAAVANAKYGQALYRGSVRKPEHFTTWGTLAGLRSEAVKLGLGPCILLRESDGIVVTDLDYYDGELVAEEQIHNQKMEWILSWALYYGLWVEKSKSGRGYHIFARGTWTNRMDDIPGDLGEIFYDKQYINLTGNRILPPAGSLAGGIEESRQFLEWLRVNLFGGVVKKKEILDATVSFEETESFGRRLDLTDDQVKFALYKSGYRDESDGFEPKPEAHIAPAMFYEGIRRSSDHSQDMFTLASAFDKITGDPQQVIRLLEESQLYKMDPVAAKGEDRLQKWTRNARKAFQKIRSSNNKILADPEIFPQVHVYQIWHLRDAWNQSIVNLEAEKKRLAEVNAELATTAHEMLAGNKTVVANLVSRMVKQIESDVPGLTVGLRVPSGGMGRLVREISEMLLTPNLGYILPVAYGTIAGFISRGVKYGINYDDSLNVYFAILGKQFTGKSSALSAIDTACQRAYVGMHASATDYRVTIETNHTVAQSVRQRIMKAKPGSPQGLYDMLTEMPCQLMAVDEAETMIRDLIDENNQNMSGVKTAIKDLYDASLPFKEWSAAFSRQAKYAKATVPIYNPSLSMITFCTEEVVSNLSIKDIADGTFSRFIMYYSKEPMREATLDRDDLRVCFSEDLSHLIREFGREADALDFFYALNMQEETTPDAPPTKQGGVTDDEKKDKTKSEKKEIKKFLPSAAKNAIAKTLARVILSPEAKAVMVKLEKSLFKIARSGQDPNDTEYPREFEILTRTAKNVQRIAAIAAYVDSRLSSNFSMLDKNFWKGTNAVTYIEPQHIFDAASFVLYLQTIVLTGYADGEIGVNINKAESVIIRWMKNVYATSKKSKEPDDWQWLKRGEMVDAIRHSEPFVSSKNIKPSWLVKQTINDMVDDGLLIMEQRKIGNALRATDCVKPDWSHEIWKTN